MEGLRTRIKRKEGVQEVLEGHKGEVCGVGGDTWGHCRQSQKSRLSSGGRFEGLSGRGDLKSLHF